jgi:hypothetical protein
VIAAAREGPAAAQTIAARNFFRLRTRRRK